MTSPPLPVLWTSTFTSGTAAHIVAAEAGAACEIRFISLRRGEHLTPEFRAVNPKAQVPALELGPGRVITELPAIAAWIARTNPAAGLLAEEPYEQAKALEWVAWAHWWSAGGIQPFFVPGRFHPDPAAAPAVKEAAAARLRGAFGIAEAALEDGRDWLLGGPRRTLADLMAFFVAGAHRPLGIPLDAFPRLAAHHARVAALPGAQAALRREQEHG